MSSTERRGPGSSRAGARARDDELDRARLPRRAPAGRAVEIDLRAVMSSVEIIVPPGLAVETEGAAIMGTFEHVDRAPRTRSRGAAAAVRGLAS